VTILKFESCVITCTFDFYQNLKSTVCDIILMVCRLMMLTVAATSSLLLLVRVYELPEVVNKVHGQLLPVH